MAEPLSQEKPEPKPAPTTPMLRQYAEAKAQAKDALLFFRLGDFYELFYDDAKVAAQLLGITLTARSKGEDRVPMAGVPHHAARGYIARLVSAGHKVALCDQVEPVGEGKQLVRREIVRLITPGTLFDEESLEAKEPLCLAALAWDAKADRCAVALLDPSTGELRALPALDFAAAADEVARARPKELLLPERLVGTPQAEALRRQCGALRIESRPSRAPEDAEGLLKRHLGLATLDGYGLREPLALQACAEALAYLQETQRSAARHVVRIQVEQPSASLFIDPAAVQNLELFRGPDGRRQGTLLSTLDRTLTAAGGRKLARWLAAPLIDLAAIRARHDAVEELSQAAVVREELSEALRPVLDLERLLGRLAMGQGTPRDLSGLRSSLSQMPVLAACLRARSSELLRSLAPAVAGLEELTARLWAALADEVPAGRDPGFVRPGFSPELDELVDLAQGGRTAIAALEAAERSRTGIASLKVRYNRVSGFYLEVTKPNLHLVPQDFQRRSSTVGAERFVTPALAEHESKVLAAEERRAALEWQIFAGLSAQVVEQSAALRACADAAACADALLSLAKIAAEGGWVRPVVDDSLSLALVSARHPVVERALRSSGEGTFVPSDLSLEEGQLAVLTGPNMAGKSTAMRQAALAVLLAQMGAFVPAERATLGWVDRLFTRVGAADDLARGQSTFMVEMAETARILHQATPRSLLLLDEIGRGTSTFDGLAIAWAVSEHIHDAVRARTIFATHYHELCDLPREKPRAKNLTMAVTEVDGEVVFLRKVVPGAASRSYGIQVARLAGLPDSVLQRARAVLKNLEEQELDEQGRPALSAGGRPAQPQLGLFAPSRVAPPQADAARDPAAEARRALAAALLQLDLTRMTPLEALNWLAEQQGKAR